MVITVQFYMFLSESYNHISDQWVSLPFNQKKGSVGGASLYGKIFTVGGANGVECLIRYGNVLH